MILQSLVQYYEALVERGEVTKPWMVQGKGIFCTESFGRGELTGVLPLKVRKSVEKDG